MVIYGLIRENRKGSLLVDTQWEECLARVDSFVRRTFPQQNHQLPLSRALYEWQEQLRQRPRSIRLDAEGVYYRILNKLVREAVNMGVGAVELVNVNGQRYIGDGLEGPVRIDIYGVPGNDLAAFMDGPHIVVHNNAQDGVGNTMNEGKVTIYGDAGDVLGYGMRGGKLHIQGDVGYRVGIHMKSYRDQVPVIIAGGRAGDFYGEYMAGGVLILLGLGKKNEQSIVGDYLGTGMHGGVIYIRGQVPQHRLGKEVGSSPLEEKDRALLIGYLTEFCADFALNLDEVLAEEFLKLVPVSHRPYGKLYSY